ncbi:hypothetical protein E2562_006762, partial [Oryza meyeriana var. granulata]
LPMAPKRNVNESAVAKPAADPLYPVDLPGNSKIEIQNQGRKLTVYASKVPGSMAYNATLSYLEGQQEKCVAVRRRSEQACTLFEILQSCSHKNIIQPIGIWEERENLAYIVFPCFDGAVSSIPKENLFEVEDATDAESSTFGFTDQGCRIFT